MSEESELLCDLIQAFDELLAAAIDYTEYEHDGDPWKEDAREMKEMDLDDLKRNGSIEKYISLFNKCRDTFLDERDT